MSAHRSALVAALGLAALLTPARADAQFCVEAREEGRVPVRGTVSYTAAFGAFERVAQAYGAANMVERRLLPLLREDASDWVATLDVTSIYGALRVPVCGADPGDPLGMGSLDLSTGGVGAGMRVGPLSLFYAGNATYRSVRPDIGYSRWALTFGVPVMGSLISPVAPLWSRYDGEALTLSLDFILGAELGNELVSASAGYMASRGVYANVTAPLAGLFGSVVLGRDFNEVPVATVGFTDLNWLVGDLRGLIGTTSIYARRLEYHAAPSATVARDELASVDTGGYTLSTLHLEQLGIAGVFDLVGSVTTKPEAGFYEGVVAYHTEGYLPEAQAIAASPGRNIKSACSWGARASVGAVQLPVLYSHGSKGGVVPRIAIEAGGFGGCEQDGATLFTLGVALNSPDVVSVFPFARNAVSFMLRMGGGR